ncbi:uracil-DNA glycosylase-like isoform X2 [Tubulanus polymorphus]
MDLKSYLTEDGWVNLLADCFRENYWSEIENHLESDYKAGKTIFPPRDMIFNAFQKTPLKQLKVVILGQDPYHDDGQAHGLAFSVPHSFTPLPPSLKNIYKELSNDIPGFKAPDCGNLEKWCDQGVLLLNATLTVEAHSPNSHAKYGWQKFTTDVLKKINDHCSAIVFLLWGGFAHKKASFIDLTKHSVIKTAHPSPLSFNKFQNCKCFSSVNSELKKHGKTPINWKL